MKINIEKTLREIKLWTLVFIIGLFLSGITAFPIESELKILIKYSDNFPQPISFFL